MITTPRHLASAIIAGLCALLLVGCGPTTYTVDEHIDRAQQAHAEGNLRAAIIEIKNALQQEPSRAEARRLLGSYNLEIGDAVAAESELVRAGELGEDPDRVRLLLARAWLMQGKTDQVIEETRLSDSFPEPHLPEALTLRGWALLARGETTPASEALQQALEREPDHAEALLGMAWVELLAGRSEEARQHLDTALASDPEFDRAWELLGDLERDARQLDAAEAAYTRAIESTHLPFNPRLKRALTRIFLQDYENANSDIQALRRSAGQHPAVSYASGLIAFYQQRYNDARIDFEDSLARHAAYMPAVFYLGATHYALNNWRQAESYLTRYVAQFPDATEASRLLALTRLQDGDSERAERALRAVLERDPEDRETLTMMGNLYLAQGRADEALHHLRQVAALEPDSATARAQIGMTLIQQGQREEGFGELERAIEMAPEGSNVRLEITMIVDRLRAGEYQQALEATERLNRRGDIHPAIYYNLKGLAHLGLGDETTAEAVFREGIEAAPEATPDLASNLAGILARDGRLQEAEALTAETLEQHPEHLGLLLLSARFRAAAGDAQGAGDYLQRAVAAHPTELEPRVGLVEIYLQTDRSSQAAAVLREVENEHGDSVRWLRLMTMALLNTGDRQSAIPVLRRLQEQQPDSADVHFMLGRVLVSLGELREGRTALEQGLALNPEHLEARLMVVELLTREGDIDQAAEWLQPAQRSHPDHPQVLGRAGAIAYHQGRVEEALERFAQAVSLSPEDRYLVGALTQAQHDTGDTAAAIATLDDWLERRPGDQEFRLLHANFLLMLEREDEAIRAYQAYLDRDPDNAIALNNLAWLLKDTDTTEALRLAKRAVELAPDAGGVLDTQGMVQMASGDYSAAVATLERAVERAPTVPSIRLNLAKALLAAERREAAREQLETLVADYPDTDEHTEAQGLLQQLQSNG